jgi:heme/copper-type cytochrome/quinol oxidase subunit 2
MGAWHELFGTDVGLLSLFVILVTIGMAVYFIALFRRKIREEAPMPVAGGAKTPRAG